MLALIPSLFNKEYILMNFLKALASIVSMCNLHVILLSKITPRYFTLFTNGMLRPDRPSLVFIDLNIPTFTPGRHRFLRTQPSLRFVAYRQVSSAIRAKFTQEILGYH
jgi:hypothetical protein